MNEEQFEEQAELIKKKYRAVCKSNGKHWKGSWRTSYSEAYADGRGHRTSDPSHKFHDIKIIQKVQFESSVE